MDLAFSGSHQESGVGVTIADTFPLGSMLGCSCAQKCETVYAWKCTLSCS